MLEFDAVMRAQESTPVGYIMPSYDRTRYTVAYWDGSFDGGELYLKEKEGFKPKAGALKSIGATARIEFN